MNISERLKKLRLERELTQAQVAVKIDISQQRYASYEHDQNMTMDRFLQICRALDVTPAEFFKNK